MTNVHFERSLLVDVPTHTPEMGWVKADYEMVTGIQMPNDYISLYATGWQSNEVARLETLRQDMPAEMAKRLLEFCDVTVCSSNLDYDCHTFTSFLMGWQDKVAAGTSGMELSRRPIKDFNTTKPNRPYVAHSTVAANRYVHSFVGTDRPGYGLGVVGPGMPLVMSRTSDLKRTFGASTLHARKR